MRGLYEKRPLIPHRLDFSLRPRRNHLRVAAEAPRPLWRNHLWGAAGVPRATVAKSSSGGGNGPQATD